MGFKMKKTAYIFALSLILTVVIMFSCGGGGGGADNAIENNSFSIGYNANGAESGTAPSVQNGNGKEVLSVSANTGSLAKAGYLFDGWNTSADGSGADYAPGALYNGKNIILYAKWAAIFNYSINSVSPAPSLDGAQMAPAISYATITGLTEKGMSLSDITIPQMIDGYTITAIGSNAFQGCTNVSNVQIPETVTNIGDNAFNGCSNLFEITMKGTVPPSVGADAFAGCVQLAVTVPQSAASAYNSSPSWSTVPILAPGTFSIIYNGNGSDGGIVPQRQVGMIGITIQVYGNNGSLIRAGCTFDGWNTKADGTGNKFVEDGSYAGPDNMTLYAQWTHPDYTVAFNGNGADTEASPSTIKVIAPANTIDSLPATPPQKNGYHFVGWYTQAGGTGDPFVVGSQVITDRTVYAKWNANDCTISYDRNGATGGSVPESHATQFNKTITLRTNTGSLARTGYRFGGWNTKADGSGTNYAVGASYIVKGDAALYAKWLPLFTITYDSNCATSGSIPVAQEYAGIIGEQITLRTNTGSLARTGYRFGGWNTKADGSGTDYAVGASYTITGNVTMYAKWLPPYTITYDSNGATSGLVPSLQQGIDEEQITVRTNVGNLKRTGYSFAGWNTKADGTGTNYIEGASYIVTGDIILYAKWVNLIYTDKVNLEIGDIVLQNGNYVSYSNYIITPAEYMAVSAPAGIIAYFGETGTAGTTGKIYMIGLRQSVGLAWAKNNTTGYKTKFSTSLTDGSGNWAVIQAADPTGSADAATNYPAFNWANTYSVIGYTNGWFMPSQTELQQLAANLTTINNSINTIIHAGGTATVLPTSDELFWSSSNTTGDAFSYALCVRLRDGFVFGGNKYGEDNVIVVHTLDD